MVHDPDKTPVASDLYTLCTREKIETWHVVRSHNAQGIVERVICKSCGSEHRYKSQRIQKLQSSSSVRRVIPPRMNSQNKTAYSPVLRDTWFAKLKQWGVKDPLKYDANTSFEEGQVLAHASFGKGVVEKVRGPKIEVLFEEGLKTLPAKKKVLEF